MLALQRAEARRLVPLCGAVIVCHTLALALYPRLYIPERFVAYGIPLLALLTIPSIPGFLAAARSPWLRAAPLVWPLVLLAIIGARGSPKSGRSVEVREEERPLYRAIAALPKNALIAGWPNELTDSIAYLGRRTETAEAFAKAKATGFAAEHVRPQAVVFRRGTVALIALSEI